MELPRYANFEGIAYRPPGRTNDGREFRNVTTRATPVPLYTQTVRGEGHMGANVSGVIDEFMNDEDGTIRFRGSFFDTDYGREGAGLAAVGVNGISMDYAGGEGNIDEDGNIVFDPYQIGALTQVGIPAFEDTYFTSVEMLEGEADMATADVPDDLVAAAVGDGNQTRSPVVKVVAEGYRFASSDFHLPEPPTPMRPTVFTDGTFAGHLALWGTCHRAYKDRCVTAPRNVNDYAGFRRFPVMTDEGLLLVGKLTAGVGHAPSGLNARAAAAHYDDASTVAAFGRPVDGDLGIWVSGVVNPDAPEALVRSFMSSPLSGDWRNTGAGLDMVAALSVTWEGFEVDPTTYVEAGETVSLVAAGVLGDEWTVDPGSSSPNARAIADRIAKSIGEPTTDDRLAAVRARVLNERN